ncbi:chemotaxis protein CheA [Chitiniphilus purpureus]|uniref:histidine kinase n=1 Tax=Chitiniphilus purpureus TaxID=2981137 RepID=A0ABY6DIH0_9NEIS|nr:chemotaxis protein CheA [Chitiniphilus sp. CD1]UXY14149.1 chemotaxis protein CheA [Chitiniphilus sp. CD1]
MSDPDRLLAQFLDETREQLLTLARALAQLAQQPDARDALDEAHRMVHTIKGSCGLFELQPILAITHAAENLLMQAQQGTHRLSASEIDALGAAFDDVADWLEAFDGHALPHQADPAAQQHVHALDPQSARPAQQHTAAAAFDSLPAALRTRLAAHADARVYVRYAPDPACFFSGEDPLYTLRQLPELIDLAIDAPARDALAALDPFHCHLVFHAVSGASDEAVAAALRPLAGQAAWCALPAPTARPSPALEPTLALLRQQQALLTHAIGHGEDGPLHSVATVMRNCCALLGQPDPLAGWDSHNGAPALQQRLAALLAQLAAPQAPAPAPSSGEPSGVRQEALRIAPALLDRLADSAAELAVSRNALGELAQRASARGGEAAFARDLAGWHERLDSQVRALQEALQEARLVPLANVFQRLPRLVRQLARQLGKEVTLALEGESIRVDKEIADTLYEPLLHLSRNALDHGIEPASERRAQGKPGGGSLTIRARQTPERLQVEVIDDGRGIDVAQVRQRALARGLQPPDRLAALSDAQAMQLVFTPGFSTAATVTEVSGRGVGMDAVRHAVGAAGGSVTLDSVAGGGTTVSLSLPLQRALTQALVVEAAGQRFGIAIAHLLEVIQPQPQALHQVKSSLALHWRGEVVPLVDLAQALGLPCPPAHPATAVITVTRHGPVALALDAVHDSQEVTVRPPSGVLAGVACYDGTALLADGSILLILNPDGLI